MRRIGALRPAVPSMGANSGVFPHVYPDSPRSVPVTGSRHAAAAASLAGAQIDLGVFDVAGRRLLTLARGAARAGRFSVSLPRGEAGLKRAGVYFMRLQAGGETLRRTVVIW